MSEVQAIPQRKYLSEDEVRQMFNSEFLDPIQKGIERIYEDVERQTHIGYQVNLLFQFMDVENPLTFDSIAGCYNLTLSPIVNTPKEKQEISDEGQQSE